MAKKLIAVTEIRHDSGITPAGETLDASKFDKKQLEALYDAGAVRVEDSGDQTETSKTESETSNSAESTQPATSTTAAPTPAKSVAAPASKETANVKGTGK